MCLVRLITAVVSLVFGRVLQRNRPTEPVFTEKENHFKEVARRTVGPTSLKATGQAGRLGAREKLSLKSQVWRWNSVFLGNLCLFS